ncbi:MULTISPECIES: hypothetical protein [Streptomyces]|nr:hypothetical protein [Streptomyces scabiei]MDX3115966.1 hypothetical protein [Streptomyces scabiei]
MSLFRDDGIVLRPREPGKAGRVTPRPGGGRAARRAPGGGVR